MRQGAGSGGSRAQPSVVPRQPPPWGETLAHAPLTNDFAIEFNELRGDVGPVIFRSPSRTGLPEPLAKRGVAEQSFERSGDGIGVFRLDEEACDVSLYDTLVAVNVARHHGQPCGHRFEEHDPERLLTGGGRAEHVRRLVEARLVDVRHAAREQDVLETIYAHETAQPSKERADTAEDEPQLGVLWLEHGVRLHEVHRALARLEASDEEDVALSVLVLGEWLRARVELDVDTVRDDPVLAGEVGRDEVARCARHRDACVE